MTIGYVISCYPWISHTFIAREIEALRAMGVEVATFSIRRTPRGLVLSPADRAELDATVAILPPNLGLFIGSHLLALGRHPVAYGRTLWSAVTGRGGLRATLWGFFYFAEAIVLQRLAARRKVQHLHAHFANNAADITRLAVDYARATGRPWSWSFTMHGPTEFSDQAAHHLAEKARRAAFVACISDFCRSQLMALLPADHWPKLAIVPCGLDRAAFAPTPRPAHPALTRILCVGRLVPEKGQHLLVQALAQLVSSGARVHLTLVGDGPDRPALQQLAAELGVQSSITFAGNVGRDRIRSYYDACDIFCLPSFAEGVPVVLMEAMLSGLPVVTTRIAGIPELVEHSVSGLVVSPGRADQLTLALESLMNQPELRQTMGAAGRVKVLRDYDIHAAARALRDLFAAEVARQSHAPSPRRAKKRTRAAAPTAVGQS